MRREKERFKYLYPAFGSSVVASYATIDGFLSADPFQGVECHEAALEAEMDAEDARKAACEGGGDDALFAYGAALRAKGWVAPWRRGEALKDALEGA